MQGTGDASPGTGTQGVVHEAAEAAKARAQAVWQDAKETTRSKLNEQKDVAADGIGEVAGALRDAAHRRDDSDGLARLTGSAAEGLERLSNALRSKDVSSMLRDVESFARQQPVAFFGLALAAGFLAVRFMKAGEHRDDTRLEGPYEGSYEGSYEGPYEGSEGAYPGSASAYQGSSGAYQGSEGTYEGSSDSSSRASSGTQPWENKSWQ